MEKIELEWGGMKNSRPAMEKEILNHESRSKGLAVIFRQVDRHTDRHTDVRPTLN